MKNTVIVLQPYSPVTSVFICLKMGQNSESSDITKESTIKLRKVRNFCTNTSIHWHRGHKKLSLAAFFIGITIDQKRKGGVSYCGPSDVCVCGAAFSLRAA